MAENYMNLGEIQSSTPESVPPPVPQAPPPPPPPADNAMAAESMEEPPPDGGPVTVTAPQNQVNMYKDLDFEAPEGGDKLKKKEKSKSKKVDKTEEEEEDTKKPKKRVKSKESDEKGWEKKYLYIARSCYGFCFFVFLLAVIGWLFTVLAALHFLDTGFIERAFISSG